jgi:hypothetical protein
MLDRRCLNLKVICDKLIAGFSASNNSSVILSGNIWLLFGWPLLLMNDAIEYEMLVFIEVLQGYSAP